MPPKLTVHPQVQSALERGDPVVALESTLITHGFPQPENIEIAQAIEQAVRDEGATPATIAILGGEITVGLTPDQLTHLADSKDARKCSRRDLPIAIARREDGATTVAATMIIAAWAGIHLFATGGIGGVHRGHPFDVSADLAELGRTPVTVVCAGAKAILDLPLTLEVLETHGVAVLGYQTDELPAFYSRRSGLPVDLCIDSPSEVADIIHARATLDIESGILVTTPVPVDDEWPMAEAQVKIDQAIADADNQGIGGKALTPYLLARISELSNGISKRANKALLINNARVAAQIAQALSQREH